MQELFIKSLQMIKVLDIKKQSEYERIITYFLVLSPESLKYISQTDDFNKIIVQAKEVE